MDDLIRTVLAGQEAYVVGGAVRDRALGRPVVDIDVACRDPAPAAAAYRQLAGGATFLLSERHGAWRVARPDGRTVDFTLLRGTVEEDLAGRDFTINAIAVPIEERSSIDPFGGNADLEARAIRVVSDRVFTDDPLRLLRAVRLEDELGFRLDEAAEQLVRRDAALVTSPAGERILSELERLSPAAYGRLDELGLLEPLGGSAAGLVRAGHESLPRRAARRGARPFGRAASGLEPDTTAGPDPAGGRGAAGCLAARRSTASGGRPSPGRSRRSPSSAARSSRRQSSRHAPPSRRRRWYAVTSLVFRAGPEIGRLLERIAEERAAGTIRTRDEALELARRERA